MEKWHQAIAREMARRDAHYAVMDEWFHNHPPESGDIILKDGELPYWMRRNQRANATVLPPPSKPMVLPVKPVITNNKPQGVSKEWLTSQHQQ